MENKHEGVCLTTAVTAEKFGISPETLKRYGRPGTGFLREGVHWKRGMTRTSSKGWYVEKCRQALLDQGFIFFNHTEDDVATSNQ